MAVPLNKSKIPNPVIKDELMILGSSMTRERIVALQSGVAPKTSDEGWYVSLYKEMVRRGLGQVCVPPESKGSIIKPIARLGTTQQQHSHVLSFAVSTNPSYPVQVPTREGNH